jgi:hypothetical protein
MVPKRWTDTPNSIQEFKHKLMQENLTYWVSGSWPLVSGTLVHTTENNGLFADRYQLQHRAACAGIARIRYYSQFSRTDDPLWNGRQVVIWSA